LSIRPPYQGGGARVQGQRPTFFEKEQEKTNLNSIFIWFVYFCFEPRNKQTSSVGVKEEVL
jgi:hypothetical protein